MSGAEYFYPPETKDGKQVYPGMIIYDKNGKQLKVHSVTYSEKAPQVEVHERFLSGEYWGQSIIYNFTDIAECTSEKVRNLRDILSDARKDCNDATKHFGVRVSLGNAIDGYIREAYEQGKRDVLSL